MKGDSAAGARSVEVNRGRENLQCHGREGTLSTERGRERKREALREGGIRFTQDKNLDRPQTVEQGF